MDWKIIFLAIVGVILCAQPVSASEVNLQLDPILSSWTTSTIGDTLPAMGTDSSPCVFTHAGATYLIVTNSAGNIYGYIWDGDSWADANWLETIPISAGHTICVFASADQSTIYAIRSGNDGVWYAYTYDWDNTWSDYDAMESGLLSYGANCNHQVAIIGTTPVMFIGDRNANKLRAKYWSGATWTTAGEETGLPTSGVTRGAPTVITYRNELYLIYGDSQGLLHAMKWTGTTWATSTSFTIDSTDYGDWVTPTMFVLNDQAYILSGRNVGGIFDLQNVNHRWRMISDGGTFATSVPPLQHTTGITVTDITNFYDPIYTWAIYRDSARTNLAASGYGSGVQTTTLTTGTYYWYIVAYDPDTASYVTSDLYSFTISETSASAGIGVHGMVYDVATSAALAGAVVQVSNSTWTSAPAITGATGVFDIYIPVAGDYTITSQKSAYDTVSVAVTVPSSFTVKNMPMVKSQSYFAPVDINFKIVEHWYSINGIEGAQYVVYQGDDPVAIQSGTTDGTGNFVVPDITTGTKYRIVITVTGVGTSTEEVYVYPSVTSYRIIFEANTSYLPESQFYDVVNVSITQNLVDSSTGNINVTYVDNANSTTSVYFQLGQTDDDGEFVVLQTSTTGTGNMTYSFTVTDPKGESYIVKMIVNHGSFGNLTKTYSVQFAGNSLPFADSKIWGYLAIGILMIVGFQWGSADAHRGAILVCGVGWFLWYLDLFIGFGSTVNTTVGAGLLLGTAYAVLSLFNRSQKQGMV